MTNNNVTFKTISVNISEKKGTIKKAVECIEINSTGVAGDAHSGDWHRQVSLLGVESIEKFSKQAGKQINYGEFAENITTEGLRLYETTIGDRFIIGETELEVTQIGKVCHGSNCAIFKEVGNCVMPKEGIFCKVIKGGTIKPGDLIEYKPTFFRAHIITLSDRASKGEYTDRSGPKIKEELEAYFNSKNWQHKIFNVLIPDNPSELKRIISEMVIEKSDIIITTGGTGIGKRDITVDAIRELGVKEIPGIMDLIRLKYGAENPNALVSRSIAGVIDDSLIFALPGSVKAVSEYMTEILKVTEHLLYMLKGIDKH